MLARNEVILKWSLYAAATALCFLLQAAILQHITIWGVIPFLYPLLAAIPATYEAPVPATVFALCVGVACDIVLPEAAPCLYTLLFPAAGLCAALLSRSWLSAGFLCSLVAGAAAFLISGLGHCFLLWIQGRAAWGSVLFLSLREFLVTLPLIFPVMMLYRAVYRKTHMYD